MSKQKVQVKLYIDGACIANPGAGGYAAILQCNGREKVITGSTRQTTNNRMELQAVIAGLQALKTKEVELVIYTDSQYVMGQLAGNRTRANHDLVAQMRELAAGLASCEVNKVKAHAGDPTNERCDQLAYQAAQQVQAAIAA